MELIPKPQRYLAGKGSYTLADCVALELPEGPSWRAPDYAAVLRVAGITLQEGAGARIRVVEKPGYSPEGYTLAVAENSVSVAASGCAGALYALVSLVQLTRFGQTREVACCEIKDDAAYAYRGLLVDAARHFVPLHELRRTLDMMCLYKLNVLHLHLTDDQGWRLEVRAYPKLTECSAERAATQVLSDGTLEEAPYGRGLYYTQQELRELLAYAAARGIQVVPELDMPGHLLGAIHAYPEISCQGTPVELRCKWGVENIIGCPASEAYQTFVRTVLDEILEVFPSRYIHIGGDEVPYDAWAACPRCQSLMAERGLSALSALHRMCNNEISEYLMEHGRQAVVWDETLEGEISPHSVLQMWRSELNRASTPDWLRSGGQAVLSNGPYLYFDYDFAVTPLSKTYRFSPKDAGIDDKGREGVLGMECALWTEWVRDEEKFHFHLYPRMQAFAECVWTREDNRSYRSFRKRLPVHLKMLGSREIGFCPPSYADAGPLRRALRCLRHARCARHDGYDEFRDVNHRRRR